MKRKILLLVAIVLLSVQSWCLTEIPYEIKTGTASLKNGIAMVTANTMLNGSATDVIIFTPVYESKSITLNNCQAKSLGGSSTKYTGRGRVAVTTVVGNAIGETDFNWYANTDHPAINKILLDTVPNSRTTPYLLPGTYTSEGAGAKLSETSSNYQPFVLSISAQGAAYTPNSVFTAQIVDAKSCVYGSCTLVNSTVDT